MIGSTISHYRILEKIGQGGMGVVYKAHDTKLDRDVALKFLPHHLAATPEEQARFLQEARAASALNHPNICAIHSIGQEGDQQFIEMEYVDGKTLRELIENSKWSIGERIGTAIQIGEALQEAHARGVVHRDVKTDNIMVNSKNQVKVMDFGLAKLKGSLKLTKTSSTVGTLAYMAPEQIQGGEVDARSDIFSFGVVLYEMLTVHLPFRGEHDAAMVYSIVNEEPRSIQEYIPDISSELLHVINRALEKDPEERYQSVHDMVIDLRRLKKETTKVHRIPTSETGIAPSEVMKQDKSFLRSNWLWLAVGVSTVIVVGIVFMLFRERTPVLNPDATFTPLQVPFTSVQYPSLSPDGNWVAFPARADGGFFDIYVTHVAGGEIRRVTSDSASWMESCDISPDGSQIVYDRFGRGRSDYEIATVSVNGGPSRRLAEVGVTPQWSVDGKRVGYRRSFMGRSESGKPEFWTMNPDGSDKRLEIRDSVDVLTFHTFGGQSWSPDGKSLAWTKIFPSRTLELAIRDLNTRNERQLTFDGKTVSDVCWSPNNVIVFSSSRGGPTNLWMISPEGGEPEQITRGPGTDNCGSFSADGSRFAYFQNQSVSQLWTINADGSDLKQLTFSDERIVSASFSPDRKSIAVIVGDPDYIKYESHLFLMNRATGHRQQLTSGDEWVDNASWSPDGKWIAYRKRLTQEHVDSAKLYVLDVANPTIQKSVGRGISVRWLNAAEFLIRAETQYWKSSISVSERSPVYEDSTFAIPFTQRRDAFLLIRDLRHDRRGWWIITQKDRQSGRSPRRLPLPESVGGIAFDGHWVDYGQDPDEWWRMSLPSGKKSLVMKPWSRARSGALSYDGKEYLLIRGAYRSKIMIVDNLFR